MNEGINLLTNTTKHGYGRLLNRLRILRLVAISVLFLVATSSMMLFLMVAFSPLPRLKQDEARYIQNLNAGENRSKMDKYFVLNSRLHDISVLLAQRPNIITSYELVQAALNNSVEVNYLDIAEKSIALNLRSDSLAAISESGDTLQKEATSNKKFKSVVLSGISYNASENTYQMTVTMTLL